MEIMDISELSEEEKSYHLQAYNHALFENMAFFADSVLAVNIETRSVSIMHDRLTPEMNGKIFPLDDFIKYLKDTTHPDFIAGMARTLDPDYIRSLKRSTTFESKLFVKGKYHILQCVVTPAFEADGSINNAYITLRDIQDILDEREANKQKIQDEYNKVYSVLSGARMGLWSMELNDGEPRLYIDTTTASILGIRENLSPEENYNFLFDRIDLEYKDQIKKEIQKICEGKPAETLYLYHHPSLGKISIRFGGVKEVNRKGPGSYIRGYHQDISIFNEQIQRQMEILNSIQKRYYTVISLDFVTKQGKVLWDTGNVFTEYISESGIIPFDFSPFFYLFSEKTIDSYKKYTNPDFLSRELSKIDSISIEVESISEGWFRLTFLSSGKDQNGNVLRCIFLSEHIDTEKKESIRKQKRLEEALALREENRAAIVSIASIYDTLHIFDLKENIIEEYSSLPVVDNIINQNHGKSIQETMWAVMKNRFSSPEYCQPVLNFTDFSTLEERLAGKTYISMDAVDSDNRWFNLEFIRISPEGEPFTKCVFVTRNINDMKREQETLVQRSTTDELTHCYNRYAYETYVRELERKGSVHNLWFIGIDINGLKKANDTLGHAAGDELIIGLADCVTKEIGTFGKLFRTGGDEFILILEGTDQEVFSILMGIEENRKAWKGKLCEKLSFSKGIVSSHEIENFSIRALEKEADTRMYIEKRAYYMNQNGDRRKR